jgi:hypothetical protein
VRLGISNCRSLKDDIEIGELEFSMSEAEDALGRSSRNLFTSLFNSPVLKNSDG